MEILPFIQQEWKKLLSRENAFFERGRMEKRLSREEGVQGAKEVLASSRAITFCRLIEEQGCEEARKLCGSVVGPHVRNSRNSVASPRLYSSFVIAIIRESASCYARVNE